jgi:hypothetical protein
MTKSKTLITEEELAIMKLKGVTFSVTHEVSWDQYEEYCDCLKDELFSNHKLQIELQDIIKNPKVYANFESHYRSDLSEAISNIEVSYMAEDDCHTVFRQEVAAHLDEIRRRELELEEQAKAATIAKRAMDKGNIIRLPSAASHKKAEAILKAAGLI